MPPMWLPQTIERTWVVHGTKDDPPCLSVRSWDEVLRCRTVPDRTLPTLPLANLDRTAARTGYDTSSLLPARDLTCKVVRAPA
jgi:hypothetical protein